MGMKIKGWNLFEIVWLTIFSSIAIALTIIWGDNLFGFTAFITGVLCVVLAAKGKISNYIFGMYNTFAYAYLAYQNGLYGEMGLNLFFFVPTNIIGFIMWKKFMNQNTVKMRKMSNKSLMIVFVICIIGIIGLGFALSKIEGQLTPYIDATTNVLSVIATFLMLYRFREQWILYIILNVFTIFMWTIRTINGSPDGLMMIVMWTAYLVNAVYGYYNWSKGAKKDMEVVA